MSKKVEMPVSNEQLISDYLELGSSYRVADKYKVSATAVKRVLKELGVLKSNSEASKEKVKRFPQSYHIMQKGIKKSETSKKKLSETIRSRDLERRTKHGLNARVSRRRLTEYNLSTIKVELLKKVNYKCESCFGTDKLKIHHKIPYNISQEAVEDIDNLIIFCNKCHFEVGHLKNWKSFNVALIQDSLLEKYNLCRERLNELASSYQKKMR